MSSRSGDAAAKPRYFRGIVSLIRSFCVAALVALAAAPAFALPPGFSVAGKSGSGQAISGQFDAPSGSARKAFARMHKAFQPDFGGTMKMESAFASAAGDEVQGFFRAQYQGGAVRGLLVVNVKEHEGSAAVIFDRADAFSKSLPALSKQIKAARPAQPAKGETAAKVPKLASTRLPDGSGVVGLAPGWKVTASFEGCFDAVGPNGAWMSIGCHKQILFNAPAGVKPASGDFYGRQRPPWPAFEAWFDALNNGAIRQGRGTLRLIEQAPTPTDGASQAAYLSYAYTQNGVQRRGLAWISTSAIGDISWLFYFSIMDFPAEKFAQQSPTGWAIWNSWSVDGKVLQKRMDSALQSMRETSAILQSSADYRSQVNDRINLAADQTIRGVTSVENVWTQRRGEIDTSLAEPVVDALNRAGYEYRVVPLNELVP